MTTYKVYARGVVIAEYDSEAHAVAEAKSLPETDEPSVVLVVREGAYQSYTQIWPAIRETMG